MESVAAKDTCLGKFYKIKGRDSTPFLDSLMKKSYTLTNFFANAGYTAGAEVSSLCSVYDSLRFIMPGNSIMRDRKDLYLLCLPDVLKKIGYDTFFFNGFRCKFDNNGYFMKRHGVNHVFCEKDIICERPYKKLKWGIPDECTFETALRHLNKARKPFFAFILTETNHPPFNFPEIDISDSPVHLKILLKSPKGLYKKYLNTVTYTDYTLKKFFDRAKKQPWYNNTLFVLTSDNGVRLPQRQYPLKLLLSKRRIPFIIYSPGKENELRGLNTITFASHVDITPTILDLLGLKVVNPFIGKSVFEITDNDFTMLYAWFNKYYIIHRGILYLYKEGYFLDLKYHKRIYRINRAL